ncbi:MAG: formylglycine-generating enzyme family protein, partial [Proteobacteria bacterium]|nr:formylglycine-generating enzyme family protein [Pseudomonadota bacterium]
MLLNPAPESARWPETFPPPFADAWGDDRYGLWAEFVIVTARGSATQRMRWIEPGTFLMGSSDHEPGRFSDEVPQYLVTLTRGFWLADTACTQAL